MAQGTGLMWGKGGDVVVHQRDPYNAEASLAALSQAVLTDEKTFYVRNHGPVPMVDPQAWRVCGSTPGANRQITSYPVVLLVVPDTESCPDGASG